MTVEAEPAEAAVVTSVNVREVGLAVVALGGGRTRESDPVDHSVGLTEVAAPGEQVAPGGRPLAVVHAADRETAEQAATALRARLHHRRCPKRRATPGAGGAAVIPKAELHVHLEGTATPALIRRLAERNGIELPDDLFASPDRFAYTDFLDFLRAYDIAASAVRTGEDYRDVTYEYLAGCASEGTVYVELIASPDHAALVGLSDEEHLDGIVRGIDEARREHGIEARIVFTAIRNLGPERALRVARHAAERPHPYVVGFNLAGDEENFPAGEFAEAFELAAAAGLGCTVHAGEWDGPESVRAALALPITRIGHGVRSIEDPALVEELAARGIVLECCPTSNVVLGLYPSYEEHPLPNARRPPACRSPSAPTTRPGSEHLSGASTASVRSTSGGGTRPSSGSREPLFKPHSATKGSRQT